MDKAVSVVLMAIVSMCMACLHEEGEEREVIFHCWGGTYSSVAFSRIVFSLSGDSD